MQRSTPPNWQLRTFEQLDVASLYRLIQARVAVFVVEQTCPYQELDGRDDQSIHIWAEDENLKVLAYARLLPPGLSYAEPSIGRVLTSAAGRGCGLGRELMQRALAECESRYPGQGVRISAQQYLEDFYRGLGFRTVRGPYLEDDIPHLEMLRPAAE
ncbi:Putative acyltransferase [Wenzhouxiangella marina]|uniref:Putative acyltransferase n=2 Tax=Wenzhouxiangella marina TaxID=1579979 RepID=A0A0K0XUQ6_9GAMM|nr:Putative acyltransferase [Wenzhouxiangella marina]